MNNRERRFCPLFFILLVCAACSLPPKAVAIRNQTADTTLQSTLIQSDDHNLARLLRTRKDEVAIMIDSAARSGKLKENEAAKFNERLNAIGIESESGIAMSKEKAIMVAHDLDSLGRKICSVWNINSIADVVELDTLTGQDLFYVERPRESLEIQITTANQLLRSMESRRLAIQRALLAETNPKTASEMRNEMNSIAAMESTVNETLNPGAVVAVGYRQDRFGKRIAGIVKSYEFRPLTQGSSLATKESIIR